MYKNCPHKFLVGFDFGKVGGPNKKNSKTPAMFDFFEIVLKVKKNIKDFHIN